MKRWIASPCTPAFTRQELADRLTQQLRATADPRIVVGGEKFDQYPYLGGAPVYPGGRPKN